MKKNDTNESMLIRMSAYIQYVPMTMSFAIRQQIFKLSLPPQYIRLEIPCKANGIESIHLRLGQTRRVILVLVSMVRPMFVNVFQPLLGCRIPIALPLDPSPNFARAVLRGIAMSVHVFEIRQLQIHVFPVSYRDFLFFDHPPSKPDRIQYTDAILRQIVVVVWFLRFSNRSKALDPMSKGPWSSALVKDGNQAVACFVAIQE